MGWGVKINHTQINTVKNRQIHRIVPNQSKETNVDKKNFQIKNKNGAMLLIPCVLAASKSGAFSPINGNRFHLFDFPSKSLIIQVCGIHL